jgi:hypothetical protein
VAAAGLWEGVDRLLERLGPKLVDEHRLGPLAARWLRLRGEPVPEQLAREERAARAARLVAPALLARVREAYDGPLLLLKGPELARLYPDGARRLGDLDLLALDAERAQEALLAAGFREQPDKSVLDYTKHHHLRPVEWPGLALAVEVHRRVMWPGGLPAPRNEQLFEAAVPSVVAEGILSPDPHHHAILVASHSWGEVPMRTVRELIDVLVLTNDDAREDLARLARSWNFDRGWRATIAAADWLLQEGEEPRFVRYWARYMRQLREPTVFEMHLQAWLSPFSLTRPQIAVRLSAAAVLRDLRPWAEEGWGSKTRRIAHALRHPLSPKSAHDRRSGQGRWRRRAAAEPDRFRQS